MVCYYVCMYVRMNRTAPAPAEGKRGIDWMREIPKYLVTCFVCSGFLLLVVITTCAIRPKAFILCYSFLCRHTLYVVLVAMIIVSGDATA